MWSLFKQTYGECKKDKVPRLGAALAYYTVFSLAPLVIIVLSVAAAFLGEEVATERVLGEIRSLTGPQAATAIKTIIESASQSGEGKTASIIGIVMLLFGATGVFCQLQDALDTVWEVRRSDGSSYLWILFERWISLVMVLGIGFLLLVSLIISAVLAGLTDYLGTVIPFSAALAHGLNIVVSWCMTAVLFGLMFKYLPNVRVPWRAVWIGAAVTAMLFTVGKTGLALYLGRSAVDSTFGAAGSLVVVLLWAYYSAQIFLFGAEFTQVYSARMAIAVVPEKGYSFISDEKKAQEGLDTSGGKEHGQTINAPSDRNAGSPSITVGDALKYSS